MSITSPNSLEVELSNQGISIINSYQCDIGNFLHVTSPTEDKKFSGIDRYIIQKAMAKIEELEEKLDATKQQSEKYRKHLNKMLHDTSKPPITEIENESLSKITDTKTLEIINRLQKTYFETIENRVTSIFDESDRKRNETSQYDHKQLILDVAELLLNVGEAIVMTPNEIRTIITYLNVKHAHGEITTVPNQGNQ